MTTGQVVPRESVLRVQHLEGGIVGVLAVDEGDRVKAGDLLVRLTPETATGDAGQLRARRAALMMQAERLRAFAEGVENLDLDHLANTDLGLDADQLALFHAQWKALMDRRAVLEARLDQREQEIAGLAVERDAYGRRIAALRSEVAMYRELYDEGHGTRVNLLRAESDLAEAQAEHARVVGNLESLETGLNEIRQQLNEVVSTGREQVLDRLGLVRAELAEVDEALVRASDRWSAWICGRRWTASSRA